MPAETILETPGSDIVLIREFNAPPELMWRVWTEADLLARWFGPEGFTNHDCIVEPKAGGRWQAIMRGPKSTEFDQDYPIKSTIIEIDPPCRLVAAGGSEEYPDDWMAQYNSFMAANEQETSVEIVMEVTLEPLPGGRTRQTMRQTFKSRQARDAALKMGAEQGWSGSFIKLDQLLETRPQ